MSRRSFPVIVPRHRDLISNKSCPTPWGNVRGMVLHIIFKIDLLTTRNLFLNFFYSSDLLRNYGTFGVILLLFNGVYAQTNRDTEPFYNWFDTKIGIENSGLYKGTVYTDNFTVINEKHQFFNSPELELGSVTFDGQTYYDQKIKYDLFNDALLITPKDQTNALLIALEPTRTEGFSIDGHPFIKVDKNVEGSSGALGFCEIISRDGTSVLLKKYRKAKVDKRETRTVYQEFEQRVNFFIFHANTFYPVDSRREWMLAFPNHKETIKDYHKAHGALKRKDIDAFMAMAFDQLFPLEQDQNTTF